MVNKVLVDLLDGDPTPSRPHRGLVAQEEAVAAQFLGTLFNVDVAVSFVNYRFDKSLHFDVKIRGRRSDLTHPIVRRMCMALPTLFASRVRTLGCSSDMRFVEESDSTPRSSTRPGSGSTAPSQTGS